jgi:iron complex transport system ATP-binding protein
VLGPNGSGKSTLIQLLQGWLWPRKGGLEVLGRRFGENDLAELRQRVAWVGLEAESEFPAFQTVGDIALSGAMGTVGLQFEKPRPRKRQAARDALAALGLGALEKRPFAKLSQGQRRLALIARALAMRPHLLLLDEPASGLDPVARERFLRRIQGLLRKGSGPLVVYVTHHLEEILPGITHVLLMRRGRIVAAGAKREVLTRPMLETAYGTRLTLAKAGGRRFLRLGN